MFHHTCDHMASKFDLSAGAIPVELGQLVKLKSLCLLETRLTGAIACPVLRASYFCELTFIFRCRPPTS